MKTIQVSEYVGCINRNSDTTFKLRCFVADRIRSFLLKWYPDHEHDVRVWTCKTYRCSDVKVIDDNGDNERIIQDMYSELAIIYNDMLLYERGLDVS